MHPLLRRQIRKHLPEAYQDHPDIANFLNAINQSYNNNEEQLKMMQRSMTISSNELFEANKQLRHEAEQQKKLINSLSNTITTLENYVDSDSKKNLELTGVELAKFIENQTQKIFDIEQQRSDLLKSLQKRNDELESYAHMVSHDLKSPLRSISTLSNWLKNDYYDILDENGRRSIDMILDKIVKMDSLIEGILKYASIERIDKEKHQINLHKVVQEIISIIYIPEHITVKIKNQLPKIYADKFRMQQLFQNIISNAVNYNDKKDGVVEISLFEETENFYTFSIADNGKGIPQKYFNKIFEVFQSLENQSVGNSGVGLAIVKKIIDLYNGKIWLTSSLNEGTTFYFQLPKHE
ncbi:ATP-binding protein [Zhouia sp. PK063]|uniref:ATP-binding protein n=1 Tax=Zhouia sp. PK063 TaxID=3373602 RepID=UPI003796EE4B